METMATFRRVRKLRDLQRGDLKVVLERVREAEFTIDTGAGSVGIPKTLKSTESARGVVDRVLDNKKMPSRHHA